MKKVYLLSKDNKIHLPHKNKLTWELIESYLSNNKWKQTNRYGFKIYNYYITKGDNWEIVISYKVKNNTTINKIQIRIPIEKFFEQPIQYYIEVLHGQIFEITL